MVGVLLFFSSSAIIFAMLGEELDRVNPRRGVLGSSFSLVVYVLGFWAVNVNNEPKLDLSLKQFLSLYTKFYKMSHKQLYGRELW